MGYNGVGPKVLFRELFGWSSRPEVFGFDVGLIAHLEVQSQRVFGIGRTLIALLGVSHFFAEVLVQGFEIDCIVMSACGGHFAFWVNRDVRMVTLVSEER